MSLLVINIESPHSLHTNCINLSTKVTYIRPNTISPLPSRSVCLLVARWLSGTTAVGVRLAIQGSLVLAPAVTLLRNDFRLVVHTPLPHSRDTPRGGLWITYQIKIKNQKSGRRDRHCKRVTPNSPNNLAFSTSQITHTLRKTSHLVYRSLPMHVKYHARGWCTGFGIVGSRQTVGSEDF